MQLIWLEYLLFESIEIRAFHGYFNTFHGQIDRTPIISVQSGIMTIQIIGEILYSIASMPT